MGKINKNKRDILKGIGLGAIGITMATLQSNPVLAKDKIIKDLRADQGVIFPIGSTGKWFYKTDIKTLFIYDGSWKPMISFDELTIYVDKTGSDSNDGYSSGASGAKLTIQAGFDAIPPIYGGNVSIEIGEGTYDEYPELRGKVPSGAYIINIEGQVTEEISGTIASAHTGSQKNDSYIYVELETNKLNNKDYAYNFETHKGYILEITGGTAEGAFSPIHHNDNNNRLYILGLMHDTWYGGGGSNVTTDSTYRVYAPTVITKGIFCNIGEVIVKRLWLTADSSTNNYNYVFNGGLATVITYKGCYFGYDNNLNTSGTAIFGGCSGSIIVWGCIGYMDKFDSGVGGGGNGIISRCIIQKSGGQTGTVWGANPNQEFTVLEGTEIAGKDKTDRACNVSSGSRLRLSTIDGVGRGTRLYGFQYGGYVDIHGIGDRVARPSYRSATIISGTTDAGGTLNKLTDTTTGHSFNSKAYTATGGTTTTVVDSTAPWTSNIYDWFDGSNNISNQRWIKFSSITTTTALRDKRYRIRSNTTNTLTVFGTMADTPVNGDVFVIEGMDLSTKDYGVIISGNFATVTAKDSDTVLSLDADIDTGSVDYIIFITNNVLNSGSEPDSYYIDSASYGYGT